MSAAIDDAIDQIAALGISVSAFGIELKIRAVLKDMVRAERLAIATRLEQFAAIANDAAGKSAGADGTRYLVRAGAFREAAADIRNRAGQP